MQKLIFFSLSFVLFKFEGRERGRERENLKGFKMAACSSERKRERESGGGLGSFFYLIN
jgi:hypothetical protein